MLSYCRQTDVKYQGNACTRLTDAYAVEGGRERSAFSCKVQGRGHEKPVINCTVPSSSHFQQLLPVDRQVQLSYPLSFEILLFLQRKKPSSYIQNTPKEN